MLVSATWDKKNASGRVRGHTALNLCDQKGECCRGWRGRTDRGAGRQTEALRQIVHISPSLSFRCLFAIFSLRHSLQNEHRTAKRKACNSTAGVVDCRGMIDHALHEHNVKRRIVTEEVRCTSGRLAGVVALLALLGSRSLEIVPAEALQGYFDPIQHPDR